MLHAVLSEGVVGLGAVHVWVEEILHVPESDANVIVLSSSRISNHKTHKTQQNKYL